MKHSESVEQQNTIRYLKYKAPNALYTCSIAGVKVSMITMQVLKRCGYSKGTPDLMIFEPRWKFHGLFIEMKVAGRHPTLEQEAWRKELEKRGYQAHICYGFVEAKVAIDEYFALPEATNGI